MQMPHVYPSLQHCSTPQCRNTTFSLYSHVVMDIRTASKTQLLRAVLLYTWVWFLIPRSFLFILVTFLISSPCPCQDFRSTGSCPHSSPWPLQWPSHPSCSSICPHSPAVSTWSPCTAAVPAVPSSPSHLGAIRSVSFLTSPYESEYSGNCDFVS